MIFLTLLLSIYYFFEKLVELVIMCFTYSYIEGTEKERNRSPNTYSDPRNPNRVSTNIPLCIMQ